MPAKVFDRTTALILATLLLAVVVVFGRAISFEFLNFDDDRYVVANRHVQRGFGPTEIRWAFTNLDVGMWIPLVWLSFMLDHMTHGMSPAGCHATNVVAHAAAVGGLFLFLCGATGCRWRSGLAAALFAVHPLRAESVAWVTERKDVLSGLGTVATLAAYARYSQLPSWPRYAVVVGCFSLALMAKPSVVPLPVALLVLDFWPLCRAPTRFDAWHRLLLEKLPLLAISSAVCAVTLAGSADAMTDRADAIRGLSSRGVEMVVTYADLAARMSWPANLAVRFAGDPPTIRQFAAGAGMILMLTAVAWRWRWREPALLAGWLWYAVMLLPVSGIVSQGAEARPDRFTYLPQIGLAIAVAWLAGAIGSSATTGDDRRRQIVIGACGAVVVGLALACWRQVGFWRNSVTLWERSVACAPDSERAESLLGNALQDAGRSDESLPHYLKAIAMAPNSPFPHYNIGRWMHRAGRLDEAGAAYATALRLRPDFAEAQNNMGNLLIQSGRFEDAIVPCREAIRLDPSSAEAAFNLGTALLRTGSVGEAADRLKAAVSLRPDRPAYWNRLAEALLATGRPAEAASSAREAIRQREVYPAAHLTLGRALAVAGDIDAAADQLGVAREQARRVGQHQIAEEAEYQLERLENGPAAQREHAR